jgi:hypothetical protein
MLSIMSRSDKKGFLSINGKPMDSKELAKFVGEFKDKVEELLIELEYYKVFSRDADGTIYNRRMDRESDLSRKRAEAGRLGGLKQNASKTPSKSGSKTQATLDSEDEDDSYSSIKEDNFLTWWERYPRKLGKQDAIKAYAAASKTATAEDLSKALDAYLVEIKRLGTEERFVKHPATFLRADRWRDYLGMPTKMPLKVGETGDVASSVARAVAKNRKNFPELEEK